MTIYSVDPDDLAVFVNHGVGYATTLDGLAAEVAAARNAAQAATGAYFGADSFPALTQMTRDHNYFVREIFIDFFGLDAAQAAFVTGAFDDSGLSDALQIQIKADELVDLGANLYYAYAIAGGPADLYDAVLNGTIPPELALASKDLSPNERQALIDGVSNGQLDPASAMVIVNEGNGEALEALAQEEFSTAWFLSGDEEIRSNWLIGTRFEAIFDDGTVGDGEDRLAEVANGEREAEIKERLGEQYPGWTTDQIDAEYALIEMSAEFFVGNQAAYDGFDGGNHGSHDTDNRFDAKDALARTMDLTADSDSDWDLFTRQSVIDTRIDQFERPDGFNVPDLQIQAAWEGDDEILDSLSAEEQEFLLTTYTTWIAEGEHPFDLGSLLATVSITWRYATLMPIKLCSLR